jgi:predicted ribosomally synthesized peptide with SipW-like signal peptide
LKGYLPSLGVIKLKKILLSLATIGGVAALTFVATGAFFSDTETSVGNTFVAGDIDLQIDNTSYAIDCNIPGSNDCTGNLVASSNTSWTLTDLTIEKFFDFIDLKPGDYGEDTISVHVGSNDAWLCAAARITDDSDQTCTEPELGDDPTCTNPGLGQGELDEDLNFAFWVDDGDNVFEDGEEIFLDGPLSGLGQLGQITIADPLGSVLPNDGPVPGDSTFYIGKIWCFGDLTPSPLPDREDPNPALNNPVNRGTGFICEGALVDNAAQTDKVVGDIQFYAEQARNNDEFSCEEGFSPEWPTPTPTPT